MLTLETFRRTLHSIASDYSIEHFVVAYSGGVDSHVLLHLCAQAGFPLRALHVHHGLQQEADKWSEHCMAVCKDLNIACETLHVDASPAPGDSPEDSARKARYQGLFSNLAQHECLLTAHHKDDQSETLLLQLFRGAGPAGLASMPVVKKIADHWQVRPLLDFSHNDILQYAREHDLKWVDDPSNNDTSFDRNFIREQLLPVIKQRWSQVDDALGQTATLQQGSLQLIEALAAVDLATVVSQDKTVLLVDRLLVLSRARQLNVLRYWLRVTHCDNPTRNSLLQITDNVLSAAEDAEPLVRWGRTEVRRYQNMLYVLPVVEPHDESATHEWDLQHDLVIDHLGIKLSVSPSSDHGLKSSLLDQQLTVRFRQGGETIKPIGSRHTHSLKKLMQGASIPPWQRDRIPLLYYNNQLVCVCGYWLADEQAVSAAEQQCWQPVVTKM